MPNYQLPIKQTGFTLVEVLVSIGIIAFISAIAFPNLKGFNATQDLDNQISDLKNAIRTAQSSAGSNIKCSNAAASTSWKVTISKTGYQLVSTCADSTVQTWSTKTFDTNISASSTSCPSPLSADIIFTGTNVSFICSSGNPVTSFNITLNSTKSSISKQINVTKGGVLSD